ncbi:unnamed protein product [Spirodela intermedia]|uniref:Uncharacterized protein n=1 Tax=Spirodela intermedia TaxID=51605 RepID=A0A7I8IB95_SPIIN|nr:unnamed protein product [Spirodela intermedia]CAA6654151.1 unnamed protein product [Spirodela intermedia]
MQSARRLREALGAAVRRLAHGAASPARLLSSDPAGGSDTLGRRLLRLIYPKRSAVVVLRRWTEEGKPIQKYQLNRVVRELRKHKRYKHALEKFFEDLPGRIKGQQSTCTALLHTFVQSGLSSKAESLFKEMSDHGLISCAVPYNHMLHLYISSGELEKVPVVIRELKKNTSPDLFTFNLWLSACAGDPEGAGKVFEEMRQRGISPDWVTFSTLAKAYTQGMEENISRKDRAGYCSLITLHAGLSDKTAICRVWEKMRSTFRKMSDAEYACMISSLVKLASDEEAERMYEEWESVSGTGDPKIPNKILESFIKKGSMEKAKIFLQRLLKKGIKPSYSTWCIMAYVYLGEERADMALECLKRALSKLKKWDPDEGIVKAVFDRLELLGMWRGLKSS